MQAAHWVATRESLSFSEQQLVDCSWMYGHNSGCGGGWMEPALDYVLAQGGAASEEAYPYLGQNGYCRCAVNYTLHCFASPVTGSNTKPL